MIHRQALRYGLKGAAFVALNVAIQMVLVESGTLTPAVAALLLTAALPLLGYVAMHHFVFPGADEPAPRDHARRFGGYLAVIYASKAANYILFLAFLWAGVWYPVAYLLGAAAVFLASFAANRRLWGLTHA